jgi:formylglycine-generating enzyme required for sulfatase activity
VEKGTGYAEALRATLAIFEPGGEAVDERTRVEVGEALGQAGDPRLHDRQVNLVHRPGGTLWMGAQKTRRSNRGFDEDAVEDEAPVHSVSVADFLIGCYPVTVSEYAAFVEARQRGYLNSRHWTRDGWE